MESEYCIMHVTYPGEPHRGPWPKEDCQAWIDEWMADGGTGYTFYIAQRLVSPWRRLQDREL